MMRHPEHHHPQSSMQRNARLSMPQMGPQPASRTQPMLMSIPPTVPVPHTDMKILFLLMIFAFTACSVSDALTVNEMKSIFGRRKCIEGVLVSMPQGPTLITTSSIPQQPKSSLQQEITEQQSHTEQSSANTSTSSVPPNNLANIKEKTPMCLINELARYNKIQHQYRLTGEQGPAHKKLFTVTLKLGNEEYEAEGASIKKAQHSAAAMALQQTEFKHPPPKTNRNNRSNVRNGPGTVTPTVELNALAMKRGERTVYVLENGAPAPPQTQSYMSQPSYYPRHNIYGPGQPRYNYDPRRNSTPRNYHYENRYYGQYRYQHPPGEPFSIRLRVGEREYPGMGYTVQAARHDAAAKAIEDIKQKEIDENQHCPVTNENVVPQNDVCNDLNTELKSPISLVHEIALKRNLNVAFEVLSEKGPPHMKVFITQCRVGDLEATGEGNGKKISKKRAAEKMLEELSKLGPLPNTNSLVSVKRKRVVNKKKQRNLIKVNTDRNADYTEEINPISRLIQIQQANKEKEPVYTVVEERGAPRRREFVIEASVNGHVSTGIGPNKKIAKRNAAESLLALLGYASTPIPSGPKSIQKIEKEILESLEKPRKVTFVEEKQESSVGGSGGRQLVPGLLLVNDQSGAFQQKAKIANPEMLNSGAAGGPTELKKIGQVQVSKKSPQITQSVRAKDQLLYLAQLLGVQVQFSDFPKANHEMYLTLVSLSTSPPQVCHGEGPTTETSHEKAALEALNVLSELGLDNVTPNNKEGGSESTHGAAAKPQVVPKSGLNQNGIKK